MLTIAHRGASGVAPENTLTAFRKALDMKADGVELDVHRCKSGELVVIHDDTVERTTNGEGMVSQMTLSQLQALRVADDEHIPTLEEALKALKGAYCFIEIKRAESAFLAAEIIAKQIKNGWPASRLWLISFWHEALKDARAQYPGLNIGASFETLTPFCITKAHAWGAAAIIVHHRSLTPAYVQEARALGMKTLAWTVNDPSDIARCKSLGIDGIMSDYPDRVREA